MIQLPENILPLLWDSENYSIKRINDNSTSRKLSGMPKQTRMTESAADEINCGFYCNPSQLQEFEEWFYETTNHGSEKFYAPIYDGNGFRDLEVNIKDGVFTKQQTDFDDYLITFVLRLNKRMPINSGALDLIIQGGYEVISEGDFIIDHEGNPIVDGDGNNIVWVKNSINYGPSVYEAHYKPKTSGTVYSDLSGTIPASIQDNVGVLQDISGNGRHLSATDDDYRALLMYDKSLRFADNDFLLNTLSEKFNVEFVAFRGNFPSGINNSISLQTILNTRINYSPKHGYFCIGESSQFLSGETIAIQTTDIGASDYQRSASTTSFLGGLHNIIYNWNGIAWEIYVDGQIQSLIYSTDDGPAHYIDLADILSIGENYNFYPFLGDMHELIVDSDGKSAAEIQSINNYLGVPPSSETYWRIYIDEFNPVATFHGLREVEMAEYSGGPNLCSGGTPSASKEFSTFTADKAFDGIKTDGDGWIVGNSVGDDVDQWISYSLPSSYSVRQVRIFKTDNTLSGGGGSFPVKFHVQNSPDEVSWNTVATFEDVEYAGVAGDSITFEF